MKSAEKTPHFAQRFRPGGAGLRGLRLWLSLAVAAVMASVGLLAVDRAGGNAGAQGGRGSLASSESAPQAKPWNWPQRPDLLAPFRNYPQKDTFIVSGRRVVAHYSMDSLLLDRIQIYLKRYRPEVAVYLVADVATGRILALGERRDSTIITRPDDAFGREFPAASLSKIVTALAALENGLTPGDSLEQIGSSHTLYKFQLRPEDFAHPRRLTLARAFAVSSNSAFGLLGQRLGASSLLGAGMRLGFNRKRPRSRVAMSRYAPPDSGFGLAEVACGFTQATTISPLHALELAAAIARDGSLAPASFVDSLTCIPPIMPSSHPSGQNQGSPISPYRASPDPGSVSASRATATKEAPRGPPPSRSGGAYSAWLPPAPQSAAKFADSHRVQELRTLMEAVIEMGTCRTAFRRTIKRRVREELTIGGKTGSLDGRNPDGRYDWFMGFAQSSHSPNTGIAVVVMQVHQTYRSLGSRRVAAMLMRDWQRSLRIMDGRERSTLNGREHGA